MIVAKTGVRMQFGGDAFNAATRRSSRRRNEQGSSDLETGTGFAFAKLSEILPPVAHAPVVRMTELPWQDDRVAVVRTTELPWQDDRVAVAG